MPVRIDGNTPIVPPDGPSDASAADKEESRVVKGTVAAAKKALEAASRADLQGVKGKSLKKRKSEVVGTLNQVAKSYLNEKAEVNVKGHYEERLRNGLRKHLRAAKARSDKRFEKPMLHF